MADDLAAFLPVLSEIGTFRREHYFRMMGLGRPFNRGGSIFKVLMACFVYGVGATPYGTHSIRRQLTRSSQHPLKVGIISKRSNQASPVSFFPVSPIDDGDKADVRLIGRMGLSGEMV